MNSRNLCRSSALCILLCASGVTAHANETLNAGHLKTIETARSLIAFGIDNRDAIAMIQAARMFNSVGLVEGRKATRVGGVVSADGVSITEKMSDVLATSIENVLDMAAEYAGDNEELLLIIDDTRAARSRGAGGLIYVEFVEAGKSQDFSVAFDAGKPAAVYIEGDIGSEMSVSISDAAGVKVCGTTVSTEYYRCEWMAEGSGEYAIQIHNDTSSDQDFVFLTN